MLQDINWLLKDMFTFIFDKELEKLYDYINNNKYICVAGGYPTLMFLNKTLTLYPDSDIDIYIMEPTDEAVNTIALLHFINNNYSAIFESINHSNCVFNIKLKEYHRPIQIICTKYKSINEILFNFDMSYNKCALYCGHTFVTFDALYSKQCGITWTNNPTMGRINKAYNKGIYVYNFNNSTEKDKTILKYIQPIRFKEILEKISPIKQFMITYNPNANYNMTVFKNKRIVDVQKSEHNGCILCYLIPCNYNIKYVQNMHILGSKFECNIRAKIMTIYENNEVFLEVKNKEHDNVLNMLDSVNEITKIINNKYHNYYINVNAITCDNSEKWKQTIFHKNNFNNVIIIPYYYGLVGLKCFFLVPLYL